jgi:hypothetical protein
LPSRPRIPNGGEHDLQAWIGDWPDAEPRSYLPMLSRGVHAVDWAWVAPGTALAKDTSAARFPIFRRRLRSAHEYLTVAAARNAHDPTAWSELIVCGSAWGWAWTRPGAGSTRR